MPASPLGVLFLYPRWLPLTETWLHTQFASLPRTLRARVICNKTSDLDQWARRGFVYSLADRVADFDQVNLIAFNRLSFMERARLVMAASPRLRTRVSGKTAVIDHLARSGQVDVVHSHFGYTGWRNARAIKRLGLRHVVTFYGVDMSALPRNNSAWRARYRQLFSLVDRVLCEGPGMARALEHLGCDRDKLRVHHLGVPLAELPYRPSAWTPGQPLKVLISASFREKKGIPDAFAALGSIRRDVPLSITLVGDAGADPATHREKERILAAISQAGLENVTSKAGYLSHAHLLQLAADHHLFLHPSRTGRDGDSEGGAPVSLLEMAALGLVIVSTRHADIPHVLPHGSCSRLAEEGQVPSLVRELRHLLARPAAWRAQQDAARRRIETEFNSLRQGWRLANLYHELVSANDGGMRTVIDPLTSV